MVAQWINKARQSNSFIESLHSLQKTLQKKFRSFTKTLFGEASKQLSKDFIYRTLLWVSDNGWRNKDIYAHLYIGKIMKIREKRCRKIYCKQFGFIYLRHISLLYLKSATKPLNVLIAFTRPLITEFADNLNLKHPLLPTISPYPTMWLEAKHNIIPISCRHYPKSVWKTSA